MSEETGSKPNIEEKIIQATIECIEKYGIENTTNRRIAAIAGVNGAAINYYFRSKEALIKKVMEITLDNAFDLSDFDHLRVQTPHERCVSIFNHLIEGACKYPGIVKAHFYSLFTHGFIDEDFQCRLNAYLNQLVLDVKQHGWQGEEEDLAYAITQMGAAVFMMTIAPQMFQDGFGVNMHDEVSRRKFLERLVQRLL